MSVEYARRSVAEFGFPQVWLESDQSNASFEIDDEWPSDQIAILRKAIDRFIFCQHLLEGMSCGARIRDCGLLGKLRSSLEKDGKNNGECDWRKQGR